MLSFLPPWLVGTISLLLYGLNVLFFGAVILFFAIFKLSIPLPRWRRWISKVFVWLGLGWVSVNSFNLWLTRRIQWDIRGVENLVYDQWYMVICNHRSWADVLVMQYVLHRRVPFLKFFIKQQLIWLPIMGQVWWAMDFPFMKRYSREFLEKHPEFRGKDIETTRKACESFKYFPSSVTNFLEGTRFTAAKHSRQKSPYRHLLLPKAGGIAFVLVAMGEFMAGIVNMTIIYPDHRGRFWDFVSGRIRRITVYVELLPIPQHLLTGDYTTDPAFREQFQVWVNDVWQKKDHLIEQALPMAVDERFRPKLPPMEK